MTDQYTDDAPVAAGLTRGDKAAARGIYERHGAALLRFGVAMTNCIATAEDVVHDTFVELLRHPGGYNPERGSLRAYLYGIARHQLAKRLRKPMLRTGHDWKGDDAGELASEDGLTELDVAHADGTPEEQIDRIRDIERIRAAILTLPVAYREVVTWCDLEELPYSAVAEIVNCPIGTVRSRLHRARALLATRLGGAPDSNASPPTEPCLSEPEDRPARAVTPPTVTLRRLILSRRWRSPGV
jgi:RNA polymerase sigma-70 factor, ECF subfamily